MKNFKNTQKRENAHPYPSSRFREFYHICFICFLCWSVLKQTLSVHSYIQRFASQNILAIFLHNHNSMGKEKMTVIPQNYLIPVYNKIPLIVSKCFFYSWFVWIRIQTASTRHIWLLDSTSLDSAPLLLFVLLTRPNLFYLHSSAENYVDMRAFSAPSIVKTEGNCLICSFCCCC